MSGKTSLDARLIQSVAVEEPLLLDLPSYPENSLELLSMATDMEIDPRPKRPKLTLRIPPKLVEDSKRKLSENPPDNDTGLLIRKLKNQRITFTLYELLKMSPYFREEVMKMIRPMRDDKMTEVREMHTESLGAPRYPAIIQNQDVIALIDGGSAINVMRYNLAKQLGLTIQQTPTSKLVKLGDGSTINVNNYVADVILTIGGLSMPITALLMNSPDYDILLGRNWLNKVNAITSWRDGIFRIRWHGQEIELREKPLERVPTAVECCAMTSAQPMELVEEVATIKMKDDLETLTFDDCRV